MNLTSLQKTWALVALCALCGCKKNESTTATPDANMQFTNQSAEPLLATITPEFSGVKAYTLISSSDALAAVGGGSFIYGGAPDGQGFLKNPDGSGYIMITNHENTWAVSRVFLDKQLKPTKGEYIVDTDGGMFRLCSATLATPEEHGFPKPLFLTTGESNVNAMTHAIDPLAPANPKDKSRVLPALGKFSGENALPLPKNAYPNKTVVVLGEDGSNGQVYLYVSETVGNLDNGKLYVLRRKDLNQIETNMTMNNTYQVEFVEVPNAKNLTGTEIENLNTTLKPIQFARVEDLDYRKGSTQNNREIFFSATGVSGSSEKTYFGRVYHLTLNANNPLEGTLDIIADGDTDKGKDIINPDNICATENYVYIQEDGDSFWTEATHDSYVWQYNIATKTKKPMLIPNNRSLTGTKYNPAAPSNNAYGLWEWGAMIDISDAIGVPGTFIINLQPHSWVEGDKFLNPSKATAVQSYKAGGQTIILTNVPR